METRARASHTARPPSTPAHAHALLLEEVTDPPLPLSPGCGLHVSDGNLLTEPFPRAREPAEKRQRARARASR